MSEFAFKKVSFQKGIPTWITKSLKFLGKMWVLFAFDKMQQDLFSLLIE